ncbi:MAG: ABC transporter ATP-binding protein [bacterium]|nr:ABC transporter ATP-binding protein [bacterium]
MLALHQVVKRFGGKVVVAGLDLKVPQGSIYGLLGPNGAGKTTLIRMIVGLLDPDQGEIELLGGRPRDLGVRRRLGYMPQDLALYPGLSVAENLKFFGVCYGQVGAQLESRLDELLALLELQKEADQLVEHLSGGTARRCLLASTLIHRPDFLVLDEPTAGVDPLLRRKIWHWLTDLAQSGVTILITTHHISEAQACNEVLFMRHGQSLDKGSPQELMDRYGAADLEAAFLSATLDRGGR